MQSDQHIFEVPSMNKNRHAECVWFSPACLKPEESVFDIFGQIND